MSLAALSLAIVGADYQNKRGVPRRFELDMCKVGEPVELRPEPDNPKDEYAVAVYSARGVQIGYVTAERAPWIGKMLREGRDIAAVFQGKAAFGGWAHLAFDGEQPVLPPATGSANAEHESADSEFWPDYIPPDD